MKKARACSVATRLAVLALACLLAGGGIGLASDVYTLRFQVTGPLVDPATCLYLNWGDELLFFNSTQQPQTVRLLGVSNLPAAPYPQDLVIPAGRSRALGGTALNWYPASGAYIWAVHLDVPDGVAISSRLQVHAGIGAPCPISGDNRGFGALPIRVFRELTPPNVAQYHLGTDLGSSTNSFGGPANARISVGIYNAGAVDGHATIQVRKGCDDLPFDTRQLTIPANTLTQVSGLPAGSTDCTFPARAEPYAPPVSSSYVVVTIDQPSFSYAISASNELPPKIPVGVSFTQ